MKHHWKRYLSGLLCLAMVLSMLPVTAWADTVTASGSCGEKMFWALMADGTLVVSGSGAMSDYGSGSAPWYSYRRQINTVTVEAGVTSIGNHAFYNCASLSSVEIPESVTTIGEGAFGYCKALQGIWVDPQNGYYTSDDRGVLFDKDMTTLIQAPGGITGSYTAPDGLTSIGNYAFYFCASLTSVTLPEGLTSIGEYAFYDCESLASVEIPESVTTIGIAAFRNCDALQGIWVDPQNGYYASDDRGVLFDKDMTTLIQAPGGITGRYVAPEGLTSIGRFAFEECVGLRSVTLPEGLTSIENSVFFGCDNLSSVTLPEGLTSIEDGTFYDCDSLSSVTLPEGLTSIGDCAFSYCNSLSRVTLPEGLTSIGSSAFEGCDSLSSVKLPEGLTSIGDHAFAYCTSLTSVTLPEGLTSIGYSAFDNCQSLTSVTLPEGLTSIENSTFYNCESLTSVTLPEGLTSIGYAAFYNCESLTSVTLPEGLTSIAHSVFVYCNSLTSVKLPEGLTSIGERAFAYCDSLTSVKLPEGLTSIGEYAFYNCDSLTSVEIPESVTTIGGSAFSSCDAMQGIWVDPQNKAHASDDSGVLFNKDMTTLIQAPGGITGSYAAPEGLTSIGECAFYNCDSLTSVEIPESVTTIGGSAFSSCDAMQGIWVDPQNKAHASDDSGVLFNKDMTTLIQAPGGITGSYAAPEGLTSIGEHAFYNCDSLTSVALPEGLTSVGNNAFDDCYRLIRVTLPDSVVSIGTNAYDYCSALTDVYYGGTEEQWRGISIDGGNTCLTGATIHYEWVCPHSYETEVIEPACTEQGYTKHTCTECGDSYKDTYVAATGHGYRKVTTTPTCTEDGHVKYVCDNCGYEMIRSTEPALGHSYESSVVLPGCTEVGYTEYLCTVCGHRYQDDVVDSLGHIYEDVFEDPTCVEDGYIGKCCVTCGDLIVTDVIYADGHGYESVIVDPTCTEGGYFGEECKTCGDLVVHDVIFATGHSYENGICTSCGGADPDVVKDPGLTLNYPTLSFEDEIIYNVYFSVKDTTSVVEMGLMVLPKMDQNATIADAVSLVPGYVTNGVVYLAKSEGIPAANMGDTLYFKVYAKLSDGSYAYSTAGGYNAKAYANSILKGENSAEMKALVVSMLNYGAEAQKFFDHNVDKLVNDALTAEQQALVKAYDSTMMDAIVKADSTKTVDFVRVNSNFKSLYPSVSFDGAFAINFYCSPAIAVDGDMTLYYWDMETMASVAKLSVSNATGSMVMESTNGMYWGQVAGIAAKEMDKTYYVTCVFESNGETITTGVIPYSLGKYCSDKAAADGDAQQAFAQATAVYGYYAKNYFASIA